MRVFDHVSKISTGDTYVGISFTQRINISTSTEVKDIYNVMNYGKFLKIESPATL